MLVGIKFNVMQNMIMNNEFKQSREIIKNKNGSVVAHSGKIVSFKYGCNSRVIPYSNEVLLSQGHVKYMPKKWNKNSEQPCMTNPEISSSPTHLEGFGLLMALQTSASETEARDKNSEDCERGGMSIGQ
jgi:hypothetical protein